MNLEQLFEAFEHPTQLDFKLNFKKFFQTENLEPKQAGLIALACAHTTNCRPLIEFCVSHLKEAGATEEEIREAGDASAIMGIANNYYRFRHWMGGNEAYKKPAGFRMSAMTKPVTGKLNMEMMCLAVSVINGCENCVTGHEASVKQHGGTEEQVHDIVRLASIINGLTVIFRQLGRA